MAGFNPRVPCGTRHAADTVTDAWINVSIHASRAGRDAKRQSFIAIIRVSIHASRAGRDNFNLQVYSPPGVFQSTRPVRDATVADEVRTRTTRCFNPRVPCGTRRGHGSGSDAIPRFNPRVPCGTRPGEMKGSGTPGTFQSTRPVRDAT